MNYAKAKSESIRYLNLAISDIENDMPVESLIHIQAAQQCISKLKKIKNIVFSHVNRINYLKQKYSNKEK